MNLIKISHCILQSNNTTMLSVFTVLSLRLFVAIQIPHIPILWCEISLGFHSPRIIEISSFLTELLSSTGGKGWNVISAGWQVTLCDPVWHVSSSSGEACCELLYLVTLLLYFTFTWKNKKAHFVKQGVCICCAIQEINSQVHCNEFCAEICNNMQYYRLTSAVVIVMICSNFQYSSRQNICVISFFS